MESLQKNNTAYDVSNYISIYEIAESKFNLISSRNHDKKIKTLIRDLSKIPETIISRKPLDVECYYNGDINRSFTEVYSRKDIECFFSNYILKKKTLFELRSIVKSKGRMYSIYNSFKPKPLEIYFGDCYISIDDHSRLISYFREVVPRRVKEWKERPTITRKGVEERAEELGCFLLHQVKEILNIGRVYMKELIESGELPVAFKIWNQQLFRKDDVEKIREYQLALLDRCKKKYYSCKEIREKYGIGFSKYISTVRGKGVHSVDTIPVPSILNLYYNNNRGILYIKSDIDLLWTENKSENKMNSVAFSDSYKEFVYKVEHVLNVNFEETQKNTKKYWYEYVEKYFNKTKAETTRNARINQFARNTELIFSIFRNEIYTYSANEINQLYLNDKEEGAPRAYQRDFYFFLRRLLQSFSSNSLPIPFNTNELQNPYNYDNIREIDTGIYNIEEYHKLYEYVSCIDYHKDKAIKGVIAAKKHIEYQQYDSSWLYILVQMTNNWRHGTVISQIPRIDLSHTNIKSLEWLLENNPTIEDANNIIFQIGRFVTQINKTGVSAEGVFTIGEPLKIAFATAISICEFRTRHTQDGADTLIDVPENHLPDSKPMKELLKGIPDFRFENRKMNRTLATLIWSVLRHLGKGLKESQISRLHQIEETTIDHYIKLSNEQVERLVLELFERNQFGFVKQTLSNLLFGPELDKNAETKMMVALDNHFGDVIKIEATAGLINRLATEKELVYKYLKEFSIDELHCLNNQINANLLPSKEKHHQCILAKCKFENDRGERPPCRGCVWSIINVYALTNIMDNYIDLMEYISKEFDELIDGEKRKIANHLYLLNDVVNQARKMFGETAVNNFAQGKTEKIKALGKQLNPKKLSGYVTKGITEVK